MKTINYNLKTLLVALTAVLTISSCTKDEVFEELPAVRSGYYILNEGGFNSNNASLSYYNLENGSVVNGFFAQKNGRGLGDTGNDIQVYGSKMYIVVNVSNTVEVVDAKTVKSIKQLDFKNNGVGRQPRYIVFNKNKAFVSSYDGTIAVIDTASLAIEKYITVGRNPEQMAIANNKLYVANSGGLSYPNYDKTVSVVDLTTLTEIKKIEVVLNPGGVKATADGKIYVKSTGNYGNIKPSLTIIDSKTDVVTSSKEFTGGNMVINGTKAYFTSGKGIKLYDLSTDAVISENIITDISDEAKITTPYGLTYDSVNKLFFVCDAKNYASNGQVYCFGEDGKLKYKITAGVIPSKIIFLNK
ncbi:YncE family protein [Pedobacter alpinus]|uniref:YncE family protein n=1 Tax=Pedobacter alpinus TaxID=1590643 RepID=A0ABW5TT04_9SPHI